MFQSVRARVFAAGLVPMGALAVISALQAGANERSVAEISNASAETSGGVRDASRQVEGLRTSVDETAAAAAASRAASAEVAGAVARLSAVVEAFVKNAA